MLIKFVLLCSLLFIYNETSAIWIPANIEYLSGDSSLSNNIFTGIDCADSMNCLAVADYKNLYNLLYRTTDAGKNWTVSFKIDKKKKRYRTIAYPAINKCLVTSDSGRIIISNDNGKSWNRIDLQLIQDPPKGDVYHQVLFIKMLDTIYGIASTRFQIFYTENGGISWELLNIPLINGKNYPYITSIEILTPTKIIYHDGGIGTDLQAIFISSDKGKTWEQIDFKDINPGGMINDFFFVDSLVGYVVGGDPNGIGDQFTAKIAATADGGKTWQMQFNKLVPPNTPLHGISFHDKNNGVASGEVELILRTNDGGINWIRDNLPIDSNKTYGKDHFVCYKYVKNPIVVGSPQGIFYYSEETSVTEYGIDKNLVIAPNPASNLISIKFNNENNFQNLQLKIFDIFGNEIKSIPYPATDKENSEINMDISELQAGVYFIKSVIGGKVEIAKFVKAY